MAAGADDGVSRRYTYFSGEKDKAFNIETYRKYAREKQEMDKVLDAIITPLIQDRQLRILDACCGIGHVPYFLSDISPLSTFLGVDQTPWLIEEATKLCADKRNVSFEALDIYDMSSGHTKEFDISISWKTLSWLPYYDDMMRVLFAVTKKHIFLSSLFYEGDIDFEIKVRMFKSELGQDRFNLFYNVYSFPKFKEFVLGLGAKAIEVDDFEIGIDLPKPDIDRMGTYTEELANGKRLQISGVVVMPWKIIRIDL